MLFVQSLSGVWLLWHCRLQHIRLPCLLQYPGVCSNSCPLRWCWHPTISSSITPFSSCLQSFPASESFPVSQLFRSGGQRTGASALASVLPMNIQGRFPLDWLVWSLYCPRDLQESSPAPQFESINSLVLSLLYGPTLTSIHDYWKNITLTIRIFVSKVMSLRFNMLSMFVIVFIPSSMVLTSP